MHFQYLYLMLFSFQFDPQTRSFQIVKKQQHISGYIFIKYSFILCLLPLTIYLQLQFVIPLAAFSVSLLNIRIKFRPLNVSEHNKL